MNALRFRAQTEQSAQTKSILSAAYAQRDFLAQNALSIMMSAPRFHADMRELVWTVWHRIFACAHPVGLVMNACKTSTSVAAIHVKTKLCAKTHDPAILYMWEHIDATVRQASPMEHAWVVKILRTFIFATSHPEVIVGLM
jgi:hypothetical protein